MLLRTAQHVHIAEDARHAQLVLILQIGPRAPLKHYGLNQVFGLCQKLGDVEFHRRVRDRGIPRKALIDKHIDAAVHAVEVEIVFSALFGHAVDGRIQPAGIVLEHQRRLKGDRIVVI